MRKIVLLVAGAVTVSALGATAVSGEPSLRDRLKERMAERAEDRAEEPPAKGAVELAYGKDALQKLDYWKASSPDAPLVIFVHGGGWKRGDKSNATGKAKVEHWQQAGYAVASLNYRLVPAATVEQQAQDVADAMAYLVRRAGQLGFDRSRIVLMGHSAGAHLSALIGTDTSYLAKAGLSPADLQGIVLLDGAAYDVPTQMAEGPRIMHDTYVQAFGNEPARQRALSPTLQAVAPNAGDFLLLHVDRDDGTRQSKQLAEALRKGGAKAELAAIDGKGLRGHMEVNRMLGKPDYQATPIVDAYLRERFAR